MPFGQNQGGQRMCRNCPCPPGTHPNINIRVMGPPGSAFTDRPFTSAPPYVDGSQNTFRARTYQNTMADVRRAIDEGRRDGYGVWTI